MKRKTIIVEMSFVLLLFVSAISLTSCTQKTTTINNGSSQSSAQAVVPVVSSETPEQIADLLISHPEMKDNTDYFYFSNNKEFIQVTGTSVFDTTVDPATSSRPDGGKEVYFIAVTQANFPRSPNGPQINIYEHPLISKNQLLYNDGKQPQRLMRINNYPSPQVNTPQTTVIVNKSGHSFYFVWAEKTLLVKGTCYGARLETRTTRLQDMLPAFCH